MKLVIKSYVVVHEIYLSALINHTVFECAIIINRSKSLKTVIYFYFILTIEILGFTVMMTNISHNSELLALCGLFDQKIT